MSILYVVATPIGNMGDISSRAVEILCGSTFIIAEDTRVTGMFLKNLGIRTRIVSCHKFSERDKADSILDMVGEDDVISLVTDAGTPCISDPGYIIVDRAYARGIEVRAVPGASAVISALSVSGFDLDRFSFFGFLPRKSGDIIKVLDEVSNVTVFYESPKRILDTLTIISQNFPESMLCVVNDMTKLHEKIYRGSASEVLEELSLNPKHDLGEYAIVYQPPKREIAEVEQASREGLIVDKMARLGVDITTACDMLQADGYKRNDVYSAKLNLKKLFN